MATPVLSPQALSGWKKLALISLCGGAGFALMLSLIVCTVLWYSSRPKPPAPWNTSSIVVADGPTFSTSDDGKQIYFRYTVENKTNTDYEAPAPKLVAKLKDGSISRPLPEDVATLQDPIWIPARQKANLTVILKTSSRAVPIPQGARIGEPTRAQTPETDEAYHERLRQYLEETYTGLAGFVLYDQAARYQIGLPQWSPESQKKP